MVESDSERCQSVNVFTIHGPAPLGFPRSVEGMNWHRQGLGRVSPHCARGSNAPLCGPRKQKFYHKIEQLKLKHLGRKQL